MKGTATSTEQLGAAIGPELTQLIDRGVLSRAELGVTAGELDAWRALSRELVTGQQAAVLGQMLGLAAA